MMEIFEKVKTLWKQQEQIKEDQTQIKDKIENTLRSCVEYGEITIEKIELKEDEILIYIDTNRFNGMPLEKILRFLDKMGIPVEYVTIKILRYGGANYETAICLILDKNNVSWDR